MTQRSLFDALLTPTPPVLPSVRQTHPAASDPLAIVLSCAVPLRIEELRRQGGPQAGDYAWLAELAKRDHFCGPGSEDLLHKGPRSGLLCQDLLKCLAILAFSPGGVHFAGSHYEANPTGSG